MLKTTIEKTKTIRVFPQGLAIAGDEMTSFVLFKDKKGLISFPVWCPVLPLGLVSTDSEMYIKNPYDFTHDLLEKLDFKILECTFDKIESDEQYATLTMNKKHISVKAYEALALCSSRKEIQYSATQAFIKKTRDVDVFEKNNPGDLVKKNSFLKSRQKYMM